MIDGSNIFFRLALLCTTGLDISLLASKAFGYVVFIRFIRYSLKIKIWIQTKIATGKNKDQKPKFINLRT